MCQQFVHNFLVFKKENVLFAIFASALEKVALTIWGEVGLEVKVKLQNCVEKWGSQCDLFAFVWNALWNVCFASAVEIMILVFRCS